MNSSSSSNQPSTTLYLNNLNDKINKEELRIQLYALFTTYGKIIDVIASKSPKMRGQAFLVFTDLAAATSAMRACEGMVFYDKPLHIDYAKGKSYATLKREDPNFVPPTAANASALVRNAASQKRSREDGAQDSGRQVKREKNDDDSDDEEMEIDDDDDENAAAKSKSNTVIENATAVPQSVQQPSSRLVCTNLPMEVTNDVLSVLFQQYQGYMTCLVAQSPTPNAEGARVKFAQVIFKSPEFATVAKEALNGFALKKGWVMNVMYY